MITGTSIADAMRRLDEALAEREIRKLRASKRKAADAAIAAQIPNHPW